METHFQAKLTKIGVGRVKGIPAPILTLTFAPTYQESLTALSSDTGAAFAARFIPLELDLFGVDAHLGHPAFEAILAKVNVTPPKDNLGPTMNLSLVAKYSADGVRLISRVGQRVAVTLEEVEEEVAETTAPEVDERQTSFVEEEPPEEAPAESEPEKPTKPAVSPQDFFKRLADESGEAAG